MCVNIERNSQFLSALNIELLDSVFTKQTEYTFAWVLSRHFDYILLTHPRVASTL